jgi:hypothetical protein
MRLQEVLNLFYDSEPSDWHVIRPFGVNYTAHADADGVLREHPHQAVYEPEAALTIAWGYTNGERIPAGAANLNVADHAPEDMKRVQIEQADVFWHGALVERLEFVSVNRDPAVSIPIPRYLPNGRFVTSSEVTAAELLAKLSGANPQDVSSTLSLLDVGVQG